MNPAAKLVFVYDRSEKSYTFFHAHSTTESFGMPMRMSMGISQRAEQKSTPITLMQRR